MEDIKKTENKESNSYAVDPMQNQPPKSPIDEDNKYGSDYHSNARIDMKPTVRLDATPLVVKKRGFDSSALAVLQWLTYAFWGSTVIAMSVLTVSVLAFYITGSSIGDSILYSVAAVVVLLPISLICDILYLRNEHENKTRIASVIMIFHAVLFALLSIGSLITIAFSVVSLMVSSSGHETVMVTLYSSLVITFLFAVLFLRTVLPKKYSKIKYLFIAIMLIAVCVVGAFGIFGPIADAQLTRNDKLIENNLPTVGEAVSSYATSNNKLPNSLDNLDLTGDAKTLVTNKLVNYKKDSAPSPSYYTMTEDFYYQLCVTYKKASTDQYVTPDYSVNSSTSSSSAPTPTTGDYSDYVTTTPHPVGEKCYKLMTYNYNAVPTTNSGSNLKLY